MITADDILEVVRSSPRGSRPANIKIGAEYLLDWAARLRGVARVTSREGNRGGTQTIQQLARRIADAADRGRSLSRIPRREVEAWAKELDRIGGLRIPADKAARAVLAHIADKLTQIVAVGTTDRGSATAVRRTSRPPTNPPVKLKGASGSGRHRLNPGRRDPPAGPVRSFIPRGR